MIILGIVGGVASGKSAAARLLANQVVGSVLIQADPIGHEALEDTDVRAALLERWGKRILGDSGRISRSTVASLVFGPDQKEELLFLQRQTHPFIRSRLLLLIQNARQGQARLVLLDAALLLETGWDDLCDKIVFVDTPDWMRKSRAFASRGWSEEEWQRREAAQWPVEQKRQAADFVLKNNGSEADLAEACRQLWEQLAFS
mgnify:CR=1 FL=1